MRSAPCRAFIFILALLFLASPVLAAGAQVHRAEEGPGVFSDLWQAVRQLAPIFMKGRAGQDPNGSPLPDPTAAGTTGGSETEGRAGQDPNG